jgi:hypothetical protein
MARASIHRPPAHASPSGPSVRRVSRWRRSSSIAAVIVLVGTLSANPAPARAVPFNIVTEWNQIAVSTLVALPGPAGGAPPSAQIHVGMVQGAVYDAVNATTPKHYRPYLLHRRFSARASQEAAVATAAYGVLSSIVSTVPNISPEARAAVLATLLTQYNASVDAIPDSPFKARGIEAGIAAADAMIAARMNDGRFGASQWDMSSGIGRWQPLAGTADPTPWVGLVQPFLIPTSSWFRTEGPVGITLGLTSEEYAAEFNEVKAIGAVNSETLGTRTAFQTYAARWWQSTPNGLWNAVARDLVARNGFDLLDSARLFAMQNLSAADAAINCWNDKYFWDFWRPVNAIRSPLDDGNSATESDAAWTPLINAPYPDHPSGHLCLDGAHTKVLQMFFGDVIAGGYQITTASTLILPTDPVTRSFDSFSQALTELVEARIWAGLHFRTAQPQGRDLGINVADFAAANYFQPVGNH